MNIAVAGLGLIGGSLAKSLKKYTEHKIWGFDKNESVLKSALDTFAIDGVTHDFKESDLVFVCLSPYAILDFCQQYKDSFKKGAIICDVCGVKESIAHSLESLFSQKDISYVGTHPMAGREVSGFENSFEDLFKNASLIITLTKNTNLNSARVIQEIALKIGFLNIVKTDPETHDKIIAYTSQLAHIVSSSYIKSPTSLDEKGFSAGSFQDMTRVARLDEKLWSQLFILNRENLIYEIELLQNSLWEYKKALLDNDKDNLEMLLKDGREKKEFNIKNK